MLKGSQKSDRTAHRKEISPGSRSRHKPTEIWLSSRYRRHSSYLDVLVELKKRGELCEWLQRQAKSAYQDSEGHHHQWIQGQPGPISVRTPRVRAARVQSFVQRLVQVHMRDVWPMIVRSRMRTLAADCLMARCCCCCARMMYSSITGSLVRPIKGHG